MKRFAPLALFVAGLTILCFLMPYFNAALPRGVRVTRSQGLAIADAAARQIGIPVDRSWSNIIWTESAILDKELQNDADRRRRAFDDPVIGPRLGAYHIRYFRRGSDKQYAYGYTVVSGTNGEVIGNRLQFTPEERGASPSEAELRPKADAFIRSRSFAGAPSPKFEQARPVIQRNRTDWTFRYRVTSNFQTGNVVPYLYVYFNGHRFAGWDLGEEYADGHPFREDNGGEVVVTFLRFFFIFGTLLTLLVIFLKKYHAGEVGIRSGSFLFAVTFAIAIAYVLSFAASASRGTGFGSIDAQQTMFAMIGFILLFYYLPLSVLVFFGWSVGESYARERWGDRLASFDAILKRDAFNATVGRSVLRGVLVAPAVAAAALLPALIPLMTKSAHATMGIGGECVLFLGGPLTAFLTSAVEASMYPVVILFILAWTSRRRALAIGVVASIVFGSIVSTLGEVPIAPTSIRMMSGFGGMAALVAIFLAYDLLATVVAQFTATLLFTLGPLITISRGDLHQQTLITLLTPMLVAGAFGIAALMTRREVVYAYEDLAPHVKRIVERERVKAEIDAANRIQAALLPLDAPMLAGASVASHYRAATEIGGDYFDFLPQPTGEIGIAFGDVSGHGLTSGIVMAMAKSALLVQVDYDSSPRAVLNVLNDIVMKTAPRRILMTFFFGILDPRSQTLRFSSAGHLDPYVYRSNGTLESLSSWGFPLGVRRRDPFREHSVEFAAGDRLILYSDGLIEAVDDDGEPFGFHRFEETLLQCGHLGADEIKKTLLGTLRKFTRNRPPDDDQTLVVVSFDEEASDSVAAARVVSSSAIPETIH